MIFIALAGAALVAVDKPDPSKFLELSAEALAPLIVQDLKRTLADPYSVRDLTICPPHKLKLKDGKPFTWAVWLGLNSKGPSGGYTGLTAYVIAFKQGAVTLHAFSAMVEGFGAFDERINNTSINRIIACPRISDEKVQALLQPPKGAGSN